MVIQNTEFNQAKETVTNITIRKLNESIYSYTVLEVAGDEGAIHLLINIRYTVIVVDAGSPILTTPYSGILFFC